MMRLGSKSRVLKKTMNEEDAGWGTSINETFKVYKIEDISDEEDGTKHKDLSKKKIGLRNYEVWLTVAAVGMLKTIDNDIPVLLEAYATLKSDGHLKEVFTFAFDSTVLTQLFRAKRSSIHR
ncbi:hypothetical protein CFP56_019062 [Quercus suber]|uniref:Uncharacterized protein n=1 Tax=Quercus suber TaxID=58331 RepID=A0AAW0KJI6_QUESU